MNQRALARALLGDDGVLREHPWNEADPFWQAAAAESIHLLIAETARLSGAETDWPDAARSGARRYLTEAAIVEEIRDREIQRLLQQLAARGLSCLLMKGAALSRTHYAQPHLRPRQDTDVLVCRDDLGAVAEVLLHAGYARAVETSGDRITSQCHFDRADSLGSFPLDVHWRIANPRVFAESVSYHDLRDRAVAIPALGPHARGLSAGDALFVACLHRVAHHRDAQEPLWLWDIHLLASRLSGEEADVFTALTRRARMRAVCCRGLDLAWDWFRSAAAREISEGLRPLPHETPEPSARFLDPVSRPVDLLLAELATLNGWRERAGLLREHLFPPAAYIRAVYAGWPAPLLPLAYFHRIAAGLPRWFRRPAAAAAPSTSDITET